MFQIQVNTTHTNMPSQSQRLFFKAASLVTVFFPSLTYNRQTHYLQSPCLPTIISCWLDSISICEICIIASTEALLHTLLSDSYTSTELGNHEHTDVDSYKYWVPVATIVGNIISPQKGGNGEIGSSLRLQTDCPPSKRLPLLTKSLPTLSYLILSGMSKDQGYRWLYGQPQAIGQHFQGS